MKIYREKYVFKCARVIGPSHIFLAIEITDIECECKVFSYERHVETCDKLILYKILEACGIYSSKIRVKNNYYIKVIFLTDKDNIDIISYSILLKNIILHLENTIITIN